MEYHEYISRMRFRFISPQTPAPPKLVRKVDAISRHLTGLPFDVVNTIIPTEEAAMRERLHRICEMPKMSTFAIGAMINQGVREMDPESAFVNVGVWHGFSLFAGMEDNNHRVCIGVDNFSEFNRPRIAFRHGFAERRNTKHRFYEMDFREYFAEVHRMPIGFYVYDGSHEYDMQVQGLRLAERFFCDGCIILVDDTNGKLVRQAVINFVKESQNNYQFLLDCKTSSGSHPTFWNGIMVLKVIA